MACRVRALIVALAFCLTSTSIYAQGLLPSGTALGATAQIQTSSEFANDVICGKNTKGPYLLGWKKIESDSESVTIDGLAAHRGSDYKIDYDSGTMSFDKPLRAESIAQVQYRCKDGKSLRNASGLSLPIELSLLQRSSSSLRFTGLYKEVDPRKANSGVSVLGLAGSRSWGQSTQFSSQFLVSSGQDGDKGSLIDRSSFKLAGSRSAGRLQVKTAYEHNGGDFAGNKEYGLTGGNAVIDLSAAYAASARLSFANSYNQVQSIAGAAKGSTTTVGEQRVAYAASGTAFAVSRKTNDVSAATGVVNARETDKIEASHIAGSTTTNVTVATTTVNNAATATTSRETMTAFQVQAANKLQVQGTQTQSNSDKFGGADSTKLAVSASPTDAIKVAANFQHASSDLVGDLASTGVSITANPDKRFSLQANASSSESSLTGSQATRGLSVQATPSAKIGVSAGISQQVTSAVSDVTRLARVEMQPEAWLKLGGGVWTRETGDDVSTITDFNALLKPLEFLSLSGGYKNREMADPTASVDTMSLDVALNSARYLKLNGSYQRNPEDDKTGLPLDMDNAALDAETHIGTLSLSGGYARKMDRTLGALSAERKYGVGLPVFGHGLFTGGYRISDACAGYLYRTTTFSLGYTHKVGDLDLSLAGSMTKAEQEQMQLNQKPDYEAQAKLGLKF